MTGCPNSKETAQIKAAIAELDTSLSSLLNNKPPMFILDLIDDDVRGQLGQKITITISKWELRMLRFCCERARETIFDGYVTCRLLDAENGAI